MRAIADRSYAKRSFLTANRRAASGVTVPELDELVERIVERQHAGGLPVCSTDGIWKVLFSRIRFATAC